MDLRQLAIRCDSSYFHDCPVTASVIASNRAKSMEKILISACLIGRPVRYDGRAKTIESDILERWRAEGRLVPVCPEIMGGLPTPRPPAEIVSGKTPGLDGEAVLDRRATIVENSGNDVTEPYMDGAAQALRIARENRCRVAILTDGSPSCGSGFIYDGTFTGRRLEGVGVVTALLRRHGVAVYGEDRIAEVDDIVRNRRRG